MTTERIVELVCAVLALAVGSCLLVMALRAPSAFLFLAGGISLGIGAALLFNTPEE